MAVITNLQIMHRNRHFVVTHFSLIADCLKDSKYIEWKFKRLQKLNGNYIIFFSSCMQLKDEKYVLCADTFFLEYEEVS